MQCWVVVGRTRRYCKFSVHYCQQIKLFSFFLQHQRGLGRSFSFLLAHSKRLEKKNTFYCCATMLLLYTHSHVLNSLFYFLLTSYHHHHHQRRNKKEIEEWKKFNIKIISFFDVLFFSQASHHCRRLHMNSLRGFLQLLHFFMLYFFLWKLYIHTFVWRRRRRY